MARDCNAEIGAAFGEAGVTADEILEMAEEFNAINRAIMADRPWANVQTEMFGYAERRAKKALEDAIVEKRNAIIDKGIQTARLDDIDAPQFAKDQYDSLVALDIGTLGLTKDGRYSAAAKTNGLEKHWLGSLHAALEKRGLVRMMRKGVMDLPVARELWELGRVKGGKPGITGSKEALAAAKIIHRLQEVMVSRSNRAGAFIRRMPGYIVRQSHDARKIKKAGFSKWFAEVKDRVDEGRIFGRFLAPDERLDAYTAIFNDLQSGRHMEAVGEDWLAETPFKGGANLAKKVSQHRSLHFKSAEDWFAYNKQFGTGGIMDQVQGSIQNTARNVALMETWGTRPKAMREGFIRKLDEKLKAAGKPLVSERQMPSNIPADAMWARVSGEGDQMAMATLGRVSGTARLFQVTAKLGTAVVAAITDTPHVAHELARHGVPLLAGYGRGLTNVIRRIAEPAEQRMAGTMLGAYHDGVMGAMADRLSGGDMIPGAMSEMVRLLMKIQGLNFWTVAQREGSVWGFSAEMAKRVDVGFAELPPNYRRMLEAYSINADDWTRLRDARVEVNGHQLVIPQRIPLGGVADAAGRRAARRARDDLSTKLEAFFSDRMDTAVITPGPREHAIWRNDTQPGTLHGEFNRSIQLFKTFPTTIMTRVWGERIAESDYVGLAGLVVAMTIFGHLSVTARDYLKGVEQPDYANLTPIQAFQVFGRAFASGGGAAFVGDFIFGQSASYGRDLMTSVTGSPVFDLLNDAYGLYSSTLPGGTGDTAALAFRALWKNIPFANLWWARTVLEYMVVYQMQEMLNPGYFRRMEKRVARDTGQKFYLRPHPQMGHLPQMQ